MSREIWDKTPYSQKISRNFWRQLISSSRDILGTTYSEMERDIDAGLSSGILDERMSKIAKSELRKLRDNN